MLAKFSLGSYTGQCVANEANNTCINSDYYTNTNVLNDISLDFHKFKPSVSMASNPERGSLTSWRPRSALARTLMNKIHNDEYIENLDQSQWYKIDASLVSSALASSWTPLSMDGATRRWLDGARSTAANIPLQLYHSLTRMVLGIFMTQTDVNGWLNRGSMFVLSTDQLYTHLSRSLVGGRTGTPPPGEAQGDDHSTYHVWGRSCLAGSTGSRLLDLGAGDGATTARMEPLFDEVFVTELSGPMRNRLAERGYKILDVISWPEHGPFDVITCFNVLDRCARPLSLLRDIHRALRPGGVAIIALVLPCKPYVETGTPNNKPLEDMNISGDTFEAGAESLAAVLTSIGFTVRSWSRVPYLCHGDLNQAFYWLDDVIMVASRIDDDVGLT